MLTDQQIQRLKKPEARREIPDGKVTGLYLVMQPSGVKSWALRYRSGGRPAKFTIGSYPDLSLAEARRKAEEARGKLAGGTNPAEEKKAAREAQKAAETPADLLRTVAADFIEKHAKIKAGALWAAETERLLKVEILPKLGDKKLGALRKAEVHAVLDDIVSRGSPTTANRSLAVLRKLGNWAIERGIIDASPFAGLKPPAPENARDRVLSDDEIRLVWAAFETTGWPFGSIAQLLLLTGARRDEIAEATWSEIDVGARTWTIPKERAKNGIAHEIPLSDSAIGIIEKLKRIEPGRDAEGRRAPALTFTTTGLTAVSGWSRAKAQIDAAILDAMKETAKERGEDPETVKPLPSWVFHDLRRTAASGMAGIGIPPHVVEAVLNHKSGTIKGVAAVYNRYAYATEKRQALDAWARRLAAIVGEKETPDNVVELSKARG